MKSSFGREKEARVEERAGGTLSEYVCGKKYEGAEECVVDGEGVVVVGISEE